MLKHILSCIPYSMGVVITIILPAIVIAVQEQAIEGVFGWSSLTFTERWPTNSFFSKIYRAIVGQDKWATKYHAMSNVVWVQIFLMSLIYIPLYSFFAETKNSDSFINTAGIALFSCVQMMWVEDYIWFLLHKWFGPQRHKSEYVPWFQNFKKGIPTTYWISMMLGLIIMVTIALVTKDVRTLLIWAESMIILTIGIFFIVRPLSMKIKRHPLRKFWWKKAKNIIIQRSPYPMERENPYLKAQAYVIEDTTFSELIISGKAIPLEQVLEGEDTE